MTIDEKALEAAVKAATCNIHRVGTCHTKIANAIRAYESAKQPSQAEAVRKIRGALLASQSAFKYLNRNDLVASAMVQEALRHLPALEAAMGGKGGA